MYAEPTIPKTSLTPSASNVSTNASLGVIFCLDMMISSLFTRADARAGAPEPVVYDVANISRVNGRTTMLANDSSL